MNKFGGLDRSRKQRAKRVQVRSRGEVLDPEVQIGDAEQDQRGKESQKEAFKTHHSLNLDRM